MFGGDKSRKTTLVEYGFRLPAAADNRPLKFDEFENIIGQRLFVSATPGDYELEASEGLVVEQIVRPTGLLDPPIEVRPTKNQVDDLVEEIQERSALDQRVLVTTLTKRMAEELDSYFAKIGVRSRYIHSDVQTLDRVQIIEDFKSGQFDVLVGVNLLREGLDMRLLFARIGRTYSPVTGREVRCDTAQGVESDILALKQGTVAMLLADIGWEHSASNVERILALKEEGFNRLFDSESGKAVKMDDALKSMQSFAGRAIWLLVDRFTVAPEDEDESSRMLDSLHTAFQKGGGKIAIWHDGELRTYSTVFEADGM